MGEITEALRRARIDEKSRPPEAPRASAPLPAAPAPAAAASGERLESPPHSKEGFW